MIGVISTKEVIYNSKLQKSAKILVELADYKPQLDDYFIQIKYWAYKNGIKTPIEDRDPLYIPSNIISNLAKISGITYNVEDDYTAKEIAMRKIILLIYVRTDMLDDNPTLNIYGLTPTEWEIFEE